MTPSEKADSMIAKLEAFQRNEMSLRTDLEKERSKNTADAESFRKEISELRT